MAAEVFISYSHMEDEGWMAKFRELLESEITRRLGRKVTCWRDSQILPGQDWEREMLTRAAEAKVFVAVLSPGWLNSEACRKESIAFRGLARIGARSLKVAAPPEIGAFQYADLFKTDESGVQRTFPARDTGPFKRAIEDLATGIISLLETKPAEDVDSLRARVAPKIMARCGVMRILDMTQPIDSAAIYTQVNVLERLTGQRRLSIDDLKEEFPIEEFGRFGLAAAKEERVDGFAAVERYHRLLILGKPGAGKTTFLKRLAVKCAKGEFRPDLVPAFVELRGLGERSILDHIRELWSTNPWLVIEAGRAMVLLDGLDELPDDKFAESRAEIESIAERAGDSPILMTCRIAARDHQFQQFVEVEVADFGEEQIAEFSRLWFTARGMSEKAAEFQTKLAANESIRELAQSPLLLTMMCLLFEDRPDFDGDRAELYGEAVAILLRKWDSKRSIVRDQPYKNLTLRQKQDLLGGIAYSRFERNEYLFEKRSLEKEISDYFSRFPQPDEIDSEKIVRSIEAQHGLLVERARGVHSFAHLTFQEYFTAKRIVDGSGDRWAALLPHRDDPRWREVFVLVASMMDPDEFLIRLRLSIDVSLRDRPAVQEFLAWLVKSTAVASIFHPVARRALCWLIGQVRAGSTLSSRHIRGSHLALYFLRAVALALDLARASNLSLASNIDLDLAIDIGPIRTLAGDLNLDFHRALYDIRRRVGAGAGPVDEARFSDLPESLVIDRVSDNPFPFTNEDIDALASAFSSYETLIACMNTSRVTAATRKYLQDTIMMPWDEIQKIPLPPGLNL